MTVGLPCTEAMGSRNRLHSFVSERSGLCLPGFRAGKARHHLKRIAKDDPVRPVHVVLVKLHRFSIFKLRICKQIALHRFAQSGAGNLRREPFA